jgi:hypothetical protein
MNATTVCSSERRRHDASAGRRREQAPALYLPVSKVAVSVLLVHFSSDDQMSAIFAYGYARRVLYCSKTSDVAKWIGVAHIKCRFILSISVGNLKMFV